MRLYKLVVQYGDREDFVPFLFIMRRNYNRPGWRVKAMDLSINREYKTEELTPKTDNAYDVAMMWLDLHADLTGSSIRNFEEVKL